MNQAAHKTSFESRSGAMLALEGMRVTGVLRNAFAVLELVQTYRNSERSNIEAVYSFPLPVEATLLHLSVRLNDTLLFGRVAERRQAEAEYEEAVASGDTAVMLEQVEPGLYTMNVGNLMTGERAEVKLRFALPLKWDGGKLRLALPTTVAPRYGDHAQVAIPQHQLPVVDLMAEHRYTLALRVLGGLGDTAIASPSHSISVAKIEDGLEVGLSEGHASADRDLVLTLQAKGEPASEVTLAPDGEHHMAHAAFLIPERQGQQPVAMKILVDCSGSMAGDSMELAKSGALHALQCLKSGDLFSVSAFGTTVKHDLGAQGMLMPGSVDSAITKACRFVGQLDADLGGTEMLPALEAVFALSRSGEGRMVEGGDVLLITDGDVWDREGIVHACRKSGHRVFVIGIGSSPTESVVREVAESTGGAAAFVSPNEAITPVIERHLQRMRVPRVIGAELDWSASSVWQSPARLTGCVFPGDTLHVFAGLDSITDGPARLSIQYADGTKAEVIAEMPHGVARTLTDHDLPRIAAAARIRQGVFESGDECQTELTALAVQYQIISSYTNYILVHLRGEEAASDMPELRQVPNMLAAGWGGVGTVRACSKVLACHSSHYSVAGDQSADEFLDMPAFCRATSDATPASSPRVKFSRRLTLSGSSPAVMIQELNATFPFFNSERHLIRTLNGPDGLAKLQPLIADAVLDGLQLLIQHGWPEDEVILAFWLALLRLPLEKQFSRAHRRAILRISKQSPIPDELIDRIADVLTGTTNDIWSWTSDVALGLLKFKQDAALPANLDDRE